MTGRQVLGAVTAIILATAVLPPAAAWAVNRRRVERANREVVALAERLRVLGPELARTRLTVTILTSAGRMPDAGGLTTQLWTQAPQGGLALVLPGAETPPDPWGNRYLVDISPAAQSSSRVRVISAGPNGVVETPFEDQGAPGGDDIVSARP